MVLPTKLVLIAIAAALLGGWTGYKLGKGSATDPVVTPVPAIDSTAIASAILGHELAIAKDSTRLMKERLDQVRASQLLPRTIIDHAYRDLLGSPIDSIAAVLLAEPN